MNNRDEHVRDRRWTLLSQAPGYGADEIQLGQWILAGELDAETLLREVGGDVWVPAGEIEALAKWFQAASAKRARPRTSYPPPTGSFFPDALIQGPLPPSLFPPGTDDGKETGRGALHAHPPGTDDGGEKTAHKVYRNAPLYLAGTLAVALFGCGVAVTYLLAQRPTVVERVVEKVVLREVVVPQEPEQERRRGGTGHEAAGGSEQFAPSVPGEHDAAAPHEDRRSGVIAAHTAEAVAKTLDLGGLGPSARVAAAPTTNSGLSATDVSQVVAARTLALKRTCYERANAGDAVSVQTQITVGPSGTVQNVVATGADVAVNKCVEGQIRRWTFPPPGVATDVNVPFRFVRQ